MFSLAFPTKLFGGLTSYCKPTENFKNSNHNDDWKLLLLSCGARFLDARVIFHHSFDLNHLATL